MVQPVQGDTASIDGIKGWLILAAAASSLKLIVDNYLSYGIVVNPLQIASDFGYYFFIEKWWLSGLVYACCFQQIIHMYLIEKSILSNLVSERTGMILHALNCLFAALSCSVLSYFFTSPQFVVAARVWMFYILFTFTKCWSFAYVNMVARRRQQKEKQPTCDVTENACSKGVVYPENVNLVNIISYMVFTPPIEYQLEFQRVNKWNISVVPKLIFKTVIIIFATVFIAYQYVIPELEKTPLYISQGSYLHLAGCFMRIILPINIIWLLYFSSLLFKTYLPAYAEIVGMKGLIFQSDWWNAESMRDYWPKWNIPMFVCFKNNIVKPLIQMGYSRSTANAVVVLYSGIMHEISMAHPLGVYNGVVFVNFVLQIPNSYINIWIVKRYGKGYGNVFLWLSLFTAHPALAIFLFNSARRM